MKLKLFKKSFSPDSLWFFFFSAETTPSERSEDAVATEININKTLNY